MSQFMCSIWKCEIHFVGIPVDAQASRHSSSAYVDGFPAKKGKQMIVTSFSDITNSMLMHRVGSI